MRLTKFNTRFAGLVLGIGALSLLHSTALAVPPPNTTVVVTPANMDGWTFYSTDSSGIVGTGANTGQMVTGPATPPLGVGSANLMTASGAGDGSEQLRNTDWFGTPLASLTALSYSTYATTWNGQQLPWLRLYVDLNNDGLYDDRLVFEPTYSHGIGGNPTPALDTWQTWNALSGKWYSDTEGSASDAGTFTLAHYISEHSGATIVADDGQGIGGIRLTSGLASAGQTFNTNVDAFEIGTMASGITTYDFEPVPEPSTWVVASLATVMLGVQLVRARAFSRRKSLGAERVGRH